MCTLLEGLAFVRNYLDDLTCFSRGIFTENLSDVEQVLVRLRNTSSKVNTEKLNSNKTEINYLGHIVSSEGVKPQPRKIKAIMKIYCPNVRRFLDMVQYCRDMWQYISHILPTLAELTGGSKIKNFLCTKVCE